MFPFSILDLEQTDSTNIFLEDLLLSTSVDEYLVVSTSNQKAGKGQGSNTWYSSANLNVQFSLLLKPLFLKASNQFHLNMIISIALVDFLIKHFPSQKIKIKWPNDIYVNNNKIAGILIKLFIRQEKIENAIIGIGLNVNEIVFPEDIANPISMKQLSGRDFSVTTLRDELLLSILSRYKWLSDHSFQEIKEEYLSYLFRYKRECNYGYNSQIISASIVDISQFGQLVLQNEEGKHLICNMGDIRFIL